MPDAHARFAPSASGRWINCPGSIPLSEQLLADGKIPADSSGEAAKRGTAMHDASERHLLAGTDPRNYTDPIVYDGGTVTVEDWMPHVANYVEYVREGVEQMDLLSEGIVTLRIEAKVQILGDDCWGSVDAHWYADTWLEVDDLKTGFHVVDPHDNDQFKTYAVGIMNEHDWKFETIYLSRSQIQDEYDPNKTCVVEVDELRDHAIRISKAIENAKSATPTFKSGDHCKYCPAAAHCTLQMDQAVSVFDDDDELRAIPSMSDEEMVRALGLKKRIESFFKAVEAHIAERVEHGGFKGFKMVEGISRRKWNPDMLDATINMLEMIGIDPYKERELRTFTDIEKSVGKGNFDQFLIKPPGKPTLVPDSDKRPAITYADIFDDGET